MRRILFVCTGNIFRSLTAEYALRRALGASNIEHAAAHVSSAGTEDFPHVVKPIVRDYLRGLGLDVSSHQRRTLTEVILRESNLVIAMNDDHQAFIRKHFGLAVPLFTEACGLRAESLPDVEDVIADHRTNPAAVEAHVRKTIDRIIALTPQLVARLALLPHSELS